MEFFGRKREGGGDHAGDDDEEKIEQFFAIVRRFRDAAFADRRRSEAEEVEGRITGDGEGGRPAKRRTVAAAAERGGGWVPKFEWEDFNTAVEFRGAVAADSAAAAKMERNTEEGKSKGQVEEMVKNHDDDEDGNLQLNLTLSL